MHHSAEVPPAQHVLNNSAYQQQLYSSCGLDTAAWHAGEKLSESTASDVRELCTTLLNCYLIQLLETGFLHADPHPGNLIRTPEGQICILDFGLMTEVRSYLHLYMQQLAVQWAVHSVLTSATRFTYDSLLIGGQRRLLHALLD